MDFLRHFKLCVDAAGNKLLNAFCCVALSADIL